MPTAKKPAKKKVAPKKAQENSAKEPGKIYKFSEVMDSVRRLEGDIERRGNIAPFLECIREVVDRCDRYLSIAKVSNPEGPQTKIAQAARTRLNNQLNTYKP